MVRKSKAGFLYSSFSIISNRGSELNCMGRGVGLSLGYSSIILFLSSMSLDVNGAGFFCDKTALKGERKAVRVSDLTRSSSLSSIRRVNSSS